MGSPNTDGGGAKADSHTDRVRLKKDELKGKNEYKYEKWQKRKLKGKLVSRNFEEGGRVGCTKRGNVKRNGEARIRKRKVRGTARRGVSAKRKGVKGRE